MTFEIHVSSCHTPRRHSPRSDKLGALHKSSAIAFPDDSGRKQPGAPTRFQAGAISKKWADMSFPTSLPSLPSHRRLTRSNSLRGVRVWRVHLNDLWGGQRDALQEWVKSRKKHDVLISLNTGSGRP
jgi:hypothetical protein